MLSKNMFSIGVDIEDSSRFNNFDKRYTIEKNHIFTENEFKYCLSQSNPSQHFAVRFAAKEAVIKALSSSKKNINISYNQIEIGNSLEGVPFVHLQNKDIQGLEIQLSLSHCSDKAIAFVIMFKLD